MVIAPSEAASTDEYLAVMFAETYASVEGLDEAKGTMNEIKTCVTATDDLFKYRMSGSMTTSLVNAVNAIEDDLNDTLVFLDADITIIREMLAGYERLEEELGVNAG